MSNMALTTQGERALVFLEEFFTNSVLTNDAKSKYIFSKLNLSQAVKRLCLYFDEIFITGCPGSCHFDNFQGSQWWKFRQNDDIFVLMSVNPI